jgi:hypothetical protein
MTDGVQAGLLLAFSRVSREERNRSWLQGAVLVEEAYSCSINNVRPAVSAVSANTVMFDNGLSFPHVPARPFWDLKESEDVVMVAAPPASSSKQTENPGAGDDDPHSPAAATRFFQTGF